MAYRNESVKIIFFALNDLLKGFKGNILISIVIKIHQLEVRHSRKTFFLRLNYDFARSFHLLLHTSEYNASGGIKQKTVYVRFDVGMMHEQGQTIWPESWYTERIVFVLDRKQLVNAETGDHELK